MSELTPQERALDAQLKQLQFNSAPAKLDELVARSLPEQTRTQSNAVVLALGALAAAALIAVVFFTFYPANAPSKPLRGSFIADDTEKECPLSEAQAAQLAADYLEHIAREFEYIETLAEALEENIRKAQAAGKSVYVDNSGFYAETHKWRIQQPFYKTLNGLIASDNPLVRTRAALALLKKYPDLLKFMELNKYEDKEHWDRVVWYVWDICKLDHAIAKPLALEFLEQPKSEKNSDPLVDQITTLIENLAGPQLASENHYYRQLFFQYLALAGHEESLEVVRTDAASFTSGYEHYYDNGFNAAYVTSHSDPLAVRKAMLKMIKPELTVVASCEEYAQALAKACDALKRAKDYDSVRAVIQRFKDSFSYYDDKLAKSPNTHLFRTDSPDGLMHFSDWQGFLEPGEENWKEEIVTSSDFAGRLFLFTGIATLELVKDKKMPDDPHRLPHMLDLPAIRKDAYDSHNLSREQCLKRLETLEQWANSLH